MRAPQFIAIPALISQELARRTMRSGRTGALYRWRYRGSAPASFVAIPTDMRPGDPSLAQHFYAGDYEFAGTRASTGGESPFLLQGQGIDWFDELHGFRWLRHLEAAGTELSRAHARALVNDWTEFWCDRIDSRAWFAETVAARLISWFMHAALISDGASAEHSRLVLRAIARQMRFLGTNLAVIQDGEPRLLATIALAYGSLCLTGREKTIRSASRDLDRELVRQILPDGGHVSRNPVLLLALMNDLLPLRDLYIARGQPLPAQLQPAIDRMFGAIRFFSHSNGELAQFNGTGSTPTEIKETVMARAGGPGSQTESAPFSGYQRLAAGETVIVMDAGKAASRMTARRAMAGTLSFELSSGKTRFVCNCGVPQAGHERYAPYFRTTAAHSTATIGNSSSSKFAGSGHLRDMLPSPLIHAPDNVTSRRGIEGGYQHVLASHDGYRPDFGITHERELFLAENGTELNGIDRFIHDSSSQRQSADIHVRFHLPPDISSSPLSSGHSILIAGPHGDAWKFTCIDAPMQLEESLYFSGSGQPRKSLQIVIYANSHQHCEIRWAMTCRAAERQPRSRSRHEAKPRTPDLLDTLQDSVLELQT